MIRPPAPLAVLFDLDGVLIDSFGAWAETVNDVARRFGFGPYSEARIRAIWGQGVTADAENLYPGRTPDEIRRAYDETLPRHVDAVRLNPDAVRVLTALGERGIRRAVVTNTQQSLAEGVVRTKGIASLVDAVSALGPGVREKPAPDLLLRALSTFGLPAQAAWMVGDTRYDAEAARAAGARFLLYDFGRGESLWDSLRPALDGANASA
jgi:HAD superfamily hydrolase (TIGR01509 family)